MSAPYINAGQNGLPDNIKNLWIFYNLPYSDYYNCDEIYLGCHQCFGK